MQGAWWQSGTIYQVYPRSFQDTNADGIGDLNGIRQRLDYLHWLGVDALWISPFYPSPMADFGYDVSEFCDIDPRFGSIGDFDALVDEAHRLDLRVILDYVPNHTSDEHAWFREARSSRSNPRRNWYIFRDPKTGREPPTNWLSEFGGSAWEWDERTEQYYYHAYLKQQPDLNWRNAEVRAAMYDVLRFWLERGVDGFRVDAIHHLVEDEHLRDNPPNPEFLPGMPPHQRLIREHTRDLPEVQDYIVEMRRVVDEYRDRLLIGEAYLPFDRLMAYYGPKLSGMHLPFNFHLIGVHWEARAIAALAEAYEAALPAGAWPNWVLGNHDRSRIASRVGSQYARLAAVLLLTLRGTPTLYYGDEIGMRDVEIPPAMVQDPWEKNVPGLGLGRDPVRTPMQWDGAHVAGFTTTTPWLPLAADYRDVNVARQKHDQRSLLSLYRALLALRRREAALALGDFELLKAGSDLLAYVRTHAQRELVVVLNFSERGIELSLPERFREFRALLSSSPDTSAGEAPQTLRAYEGVVLAPR
jgi:alpha-glucosidase